MTQKNKENKTILKKKCESENAEKLRKRRNGEKPDAEEEICHLCSKVLPENLADTTYYEGKIVHVSCANDAYKEAAEA